MSKLTFYKPPTIQKGYIFNPQKSFFSVVIPEETTNLIFNPETQHLNDFSVAGINATIELDTNELLYGTSSLHANMLENGVIMYSVATSLIPNTVYTFSVYIKGTGKMRLAIHNVTTDTTHATSQVVEANQTLWTRHILTFTTPDPGIMETIQVMIVAEISEMWVNGLQLEQKPYATTFCSGNLAGLLINETPKPYFWAATPHYSPSIRLKNTRDGGRLVSLETLGFHVTGFNGMGLPGFDISTSTIATGLGSIYQGSTISERDIEICGVLISPTVKDFFSSRGLLTHAMQPSVVGSAQTFKIVYSVYECEKQICEQVEMLVAYESGLEGDIQSLLGEEICINLKMLDPLFKRLGNNAVTLNVFREVIEENGPIGTDINGEWNAMGSDDYSAMFETTAGTIMDLTIGPDNNLYLGGVASVAKGSHLVVRWNGIGWDSVGVCYEVDGITLAYGNAEVIIAGPDNTLYVGGNFDAIGNENGVVTFNDAGNLGAVTAGTRLGIARYRIATNTWECIGRFNNSAVSPSAYSVFDMKLLQDNRIAIVGAFLDPQDNESPFNIYSDSRNVILFNPTTDDFEYLVTEPGNTNVIGTTAADIVLTVEQAPNGEIWFGGQFDFICDDAEQAINVALYGHYGVFNYIQGTPGLHPNANILGGPVYVIKATETNDIYIGGDFDADDGYDSLYTDYPPYIAARTTTHLVGTATFTLSKYDRDYSAWFSVGILGMIGYNDIMNPYRRGIVHDMHVAKNNQIHIVGQFNFANTYFPDTSYEALTPPLGADYVTLEQALSVQTPNCNGYIIWDGSNFIQPDILLNNEYDAFMEEDEGPRIITTITLGELYENKYAEHSSAGTPANYIYSLPGTGGANINPGFERAIYLGTLNGNYSFVSKDIAFVDLECNDYAKPIFVINGPGQLKSITNESTGAIIYIDYTLSAGETIVLDLTQPLFTLTSNIQGNLRGIIKPNSTISSFVLGSGTIGVSVNMDLSTVGEESVPSLMKWRTSYWAVDKACSDNCDDAGKYNA